MSEPSGTVTVDTTGPDGPSAPDLVASGDSGPSTNGAWTNTSRHLDTYVSDPAATSTHTPCSSPR